jgi:hypothetical protein
MDQEEQEILAKFRQMTPENRLNFLSNARLVLATQENTRRAMNAAPPVHIKLPAHSLPPSQEPQTRLVSSFVIVFCIVKISIAPVFPVASLQVLTA